MPSARLWCRPEAWHGGRLAVAAMASVLVLSTARAQQQQPTLPTTPPPPSPPLVFLPAQPELEPKAVELLQATSARLAAAKSEAIRELLARRQCRLLERLLDC